MTSITRRTFLQSGTKSLAVLCAGGCLSRFNRLYAAVTPQEDYKALVCIFMMGGNDGNNVIVPIKTESQTYDDYFRVRGATLGLKQNELGEVATARGPETYGLHPQLKPLRELYLQSQGKVAFIANIGTLLKPISKQQYQHGAPVPGNLYSHSDQQQQWQTASVPASFHTGWAGRAANVLTPVNLPSKFPLSVSTAGNSLFLAGDSPQVSMINGSLGLSAADGSPIVAARDNAFQEILNFQTGLSLIQKANQVTADGLRAAKELNAVLSVGSPLQTPFPSSSLGKQLQQVAQIISVRKALGMKRQIFFVSFGDFDTHTAAMPRQNKLLADLAVSMSAFYHAAMELGLEKQVLTFTESEFGRTLQPSSGAGSDHAWGSHQIVMGGAVKAADVYGRFPILALNGPDDISGRGVWLPSISLDQFGATLASWFGVPDDSLSTVFPNLAAFTPQRLTFLSV
jgi:uncharacterized protein (DUF1501 family)